MGAFDEAGQIGDDEGAAEFCAVAAGTAVSINDAKIWLERGEGIICDFRTRCGNYGNQRGFAGVRKTDKSNIGEQLQFKAKMPLFSGETIFVFARSLMPGLGKMLIAASAASALRDQHALSGHGQVSDGFARLFVVSERTDGNEKVHVRAGMAAAVRTF